MAVTVTMTVAMLLVVVSARDEKRAAVARAALLAAEVRRRREGLGQSLSGAVGVEDLGPPFLAFVHDARVLELLDEGFLASVDRR